MADTLVDIMYHLLGTNPVVWIAWGIYLTVVTFLLVIALGEYRETRERLISTLVVVVTWPLWVSFVYAYLWSKVEK